MRRHEDIRLTLHAWPWIWFTANQVRRAAVGTYTLAKVEVTLRGLVHTGQAIRRVEAGKPVYRALRGRVFGPVTAAATRPLILPLNPEF